LTSTAFVVGGVSEVRGMVFEQDVKGRHRQTQSRRFIDAAFSIK